MVVDTDPTFWDQYFEVLAPTVVNTTGRSTTQVWVFITFEDAVNIPASMIMGTLESTIFQPLLVTKGSPPDRHNNDQ